MADEQETPDQRNERLWLERYRRQLRIQYPERFHGSKYVPHQGKQERARRLKQAEENSHS